MEYRAMMLEKNLSASTINVRLSAVRKLIGEARRKETKQTLQIEGWKKWPTSLTFGSAAVWPVFTSR